MIGDWVFNTHHKQAIRITRYDFFVHGHRANGSQYIIADIPTVGRDLEPIPLTAEILEKNGFGVNDYNEEYDEDYGIEVEMNFEHWTTEGGTCSGYFQTLRYVHELQHALRLCGIEKEIVL